MQAWSRSLTVVRLAGALGAGTCIAVALGSPASAHTELDPGAVAPGAVVRLELVVANESSTAGTTQVELRFPAAFGLVELPAVDGWTAAPIGGSVGGDVTGITWFRPTAPVEAGPRLPFAIGPLPRTIGRLQFTVLQTYGDGTSVPWADPWPQGAPEPRRPGPILDVVSGGAGEVAVAVTTTAPAGSGVATSVPDAVTTTVLAAGAPADDADRPRQGSPSPGSWLSIAGATALVAAIAAFVLRRRRRTGPRTPA